MSTELIKARSALSGIGTLLKQEKVLPAVLALHDALGLITRTPLIKSERAEFERSVETSVYKLNNDPNLRKVYPILLSYTPGAESELQGMLRELLGELQESAVADARKLLAERERQKQEGLAKGRQMVIEGQIEQATHLFEKMIKYYHDDMELKVDIGELFLETGHVEKAFDYLITTLGHKPESVHILNRIGMGLRKLRKYTEAEECFQQALKMSDDDERLFFNLGRVHIDSCQWDKAAEAASKALSINPGLEHAQKMRDFALRKKES
ncbi:Tetratricopeptide repeat-containing protein [Desulfonatronum thiosulfatophilum]|uniref:Tetratricopeptide repeat-containing protein n=1 Tax=Desulfonatronum thiosulfatophilum TaxID=617002 RepID=A0A1G6D387_9BACT|nr:tetratricopeptide repeat protein [Desulfonatronum thiosulfatophilum]SDB39617.1 Tetratricopeptide repeat-containing protein [Desulfonatronum thiosulfatophilum]